jgi:hypothetical protein
MCGNQPCSNVISIKRPRGRFRCSRSSSACFPFVISSRAGIDRLRQPCTQIMPSGVALQIAWREGRGFIALYNAAGLDTRLCPPGPRNSRTTPCIGTTIVKRGSRRRGARLKIFERPHVPGAQSPGAGSGSARDLPKIPGRPHVPGPQSAERAGKRPWPCRKFRCWRGLTLRAWFWNEEWPDLNLVLA